MRRFIRPVSTRNSYESPRQRSITRRNYLRRPALSALAEGSDVVDPRRNFAQRLDLEIASGSVAAEVQGAESGTDGTGEVLVQGVADVEDRAGGAAELAEGFLENDRGGFDEAGLARNDEAVEVAVEPELGEERPEPFVPVRDDSDVQALGRQSLQGGDDVVEDSPVPGVGEFLVQRFEEGGAGRLGDQTVEDVIDEAHPVVAVMLERAETAPDLGEAAVEGGGVDGALAVLGGDAGVDFADGGVGGDEGPTRRDLQPGAEHAGRAEALLGDLQHPLEKDRGGPLEAGLVA